MRLGWDVDAGEGANWTLPMREFGAVTSAPIQDPSESRQSTPILGFPRNGEERSTQEVFRRLGFSAGSWTIPMLDRTLSSRPKRDLFPKQRVAALIPWALSIKLIKTH
jgi:hypothetical protein